MLLLFLFTVAICYYLLLSPPSCYSLHCVTLHYTAASCGCCNGSAAAAASAQLCNCSDTSSSVMNSCLFRLCCIFLTSCKGSGALLLHFPSSRSSSSSCNEWSGSTHICHLHSTLYLPLQPLPGYCSHNTLKSTLMHSLLLNTVYPSLTGGLPYCMRLMTPLHPLPYFSPRYIVLLGCVHVHVHKHEHKHEPSETPNCDVTAVSHF